MQICGDNYVKLIKPRDIRIIITAYSTRVRRDNYNNGYKNEIDINANDSDVSNLI